MEPGCHPELQGTCPREGASINIAPATSLKMSIISGAAGRMAERRAGAAVQADLSLQRQRS